ncbi:HAD family phosphatase [Gemella sp. zg-1178]|uniref:HAD family hydrolase n=1 Tax=Gemella sp. zg-1178 TaxID=2840372 RepID=UPI00207B4993|nr:HAD family phosphatase [Gemella sp. zg-1178]
MIKKLEAVIFDFDGTIVDTEKTYYEVMSELIKKHTNIELDIINYIKNVPGTSAEQCKKYIMSTYDMSEEKYSKLEKDLTSMYDRFIKSPLLPYIEDTFKLLIANNIKIGVASNGSLEHIIDGLKEHNLYNYVDDIVTKYDVENGKPAPDIYLAAAYRLGVSIENCIAVEDSKPGSLAAISAGAYLILQPNEITKYFDFSDIKFNKINCNLYEEIKKIIKEQ